jgi:hypothetical protein
MKASIGAVVLGGALVLALATACGESDSGSAGNKDQFISQMCAEFSDCCAAAERPSDGAQCRAFYGAFAPAAGYDEAAASDCLAELRALGSDKCETYAFDAPSCDDVFSAGGTKQPGEPCEEDSECAPSEDGDVECVSDFVGDATVQQCQVRLVGEAGSSPCVGTKDGNVIYGSGSSDEGIPATGYLCHVADGLSCDSATGACEAMGAPGEPCAGGLYSCVPVAYCDFATQTCQERLALGATCASHDECAESAYCDDTDSVCVKRRGKGEGCTSNQECSSDNCTNETCGANDDLSLTFLCGSAN